MHEKRGIIEAGRTNPERASDPKNEEKQASVEQLDDDVTKRAADAVASEFQEEVQ